MNTIAKLPAILALLISLTSLAFGQDFTSGTGKDITEPITRPQVVSLLADSDVHVMTSLNLNELRDIEVPENFSFREKIGWSLDFLLNPMEYRARVPIFGYKWNDVCFGAVENRRLLDRLETGTELIHGALGLVVDRDRVHFNWYGTVQQACVGMEGPAHASGGSGGRLSEIHDVVSDLSVELLASVEPDDATRFLLTTVPLRNVEVIGEYLGICDAAAIRPDSESICHARLASIQTMIE